MVRWERVKESGVRVSKKCKDFSVFGIRLRGVICGDELKEAMEDFRVDDEGLDVISEEEVIEGRKNLPVDSMTTMGLVSWLRRERN
jgi:GTP cyclohydrolase II